ncbi:PerC family transcriptional regulator [Enterobacteriaceae bacterium LUAb1]
MNSYEIVTTFIRNHPGVSTKIIMSETGLGPYALRHILTGLAARDLIRQARIKTQPLCWWPCQAETTKNPAYAVWYRLSEKAEALEKKAFWHRAASVWIQAFDATEDEMLRYRATLHRTRCLEKAARPCETYEGIAIASADGVDTWNM